MTVTLTNRTRRMKVYNLSHEVYCKALRKCACTIIAGRNERRICSSLTIPASYRLECVDEAVLSVPEISAAVRVGDIAVDTLKRKKSASRSSLKDSAPEVTNE